MLKRKRVTCDVHITIIPTTTTITTVAAATAVIVKGPSVVMMMMTWRVVMCFVLNYECTVREKGLTAPPHHESESLKINYNCMCNIFYSA